MSTRVKEIVKNWGDWNDEQRSVFILGAELTNGKTVFDLNFDRRDKLAEITFSDGSMWLVSDPDIVVYDHDEPIHAMHVTAEVEAKESEIEETP